MAGIFLAHTGTHILIDHIRSHVVPFLASPDMVRPSPCNGSLLRNKAALLRHAREDGRTAHLYSKASLMRSIMQHSTSGCADQLGIFASYGLATLELVGITRGFSPH